MPAKKLSSIDALKRGVGSVPAAEMPPTPGGISSEPERRPRPEKPVRFTLDLDREHHRLLKETAARWEITGSQLMRALLDELAADGDLATRVRARAWQARR